MELRFAETETRMIEDKAGHWIEGYGAIFGNTYFVPQDGFFERMQPNAFDKSLARRQQIESRYNHSKDHVLGNTETGTLQVWSDEKGLRYRVKFNPNDPDHQKVKAKMESGLIKGSSIAFRATKVSFRSESQGSVACIEDAELYELGPVNEPCNPAAFVSVRSQGTEPTLQAMFKEWQETQERIRWAESFEKTA